MKIVSWNCQGGFELNIKHQKITSMIPDIAVIQDCVHPSKLEGLMDFSNAVWVGANKEKGLCVLAFSEDYQISNLVDEVKYEWIVPIKVSGKINCTILAVWARRMPGYSYGKLIAAALKEYEQFFTDDEIIIIGDFNVDKNVSSSYSGLGGKQGFDNLIDLFNNRGLTSCYHYFNKEEFGKESKANYFHYGNSERPFHIHYCLVSAGILKNTQQFSIIQDEEWTSVGNHFPLVLEVSTYQDGGNKDHILKRIDITPDMLKEGYNFIINNEISTNEEIDEAVKYIKALRIMKKDD